MHKFLDLLARIVQLLPSSTQHEAVNLAAMAYDAGWSDGRNIEAKCSTLPAGTVLDSMVRNIAEGNKIRAIKDWRDTVPDGTLKEGKDFVDCLEYLYRTRA